MCCQYTLTINCDKIVDNTSYIRKKKKLLVIYSKYNLLIKISENKSNDVCIATLIS